MNTETLTEGLVQEQECNDSLVLVSRLRELFDPFESVPWYCDPITVEQVLEAVSQQRLQPSAWTNDTSCVDWTADQHIARIAYLVVHGWNDAIDVDVGVPWMGGAVPWPVTDGNHRLAAAIVRNDEYILTGISGCVAYIEEVLGPILSPEPTNTNKSRLKP